VFIVEHVVELDVDECDEEAQGGKDEKETVGFS
jgi:hypothetical protein